MAGLVTLAVPGCAAPTASMLGCPSVQLGCQTMSGVITHQAAGVNGLQVPRGNQDDRLAGQRLLQRQHAGARVDALPQLLLHLRHQGLAGGRARRPLCTARPAAAQRSESPTPGSHLHIGLPRLPAVARGARFNSMRPGSKRLASDTAIVKRRRLLATVPFPTSKCWTSIMYSTLENHHGSMETLSRTPNLRSPRACGGADFVVRAKS